MNRNLYTILISVAAVSACGEENNNSEPELSGIVEEFSAAQCKRIFECCDTAERLTLFSAEIEETACPGQLTSFFSAFATPAWESALSRGSIKVETDAQTGCLDALRARNCAELSPGQAASIMTIPACRDFLAPQLTTSAFCREDFECISGFCARAPGAEEGSCKVVPQAGSACEESSCGNGSGLYCEAEACTPQRPSGEPCTRNDECVSLNCVSDTNGARVCGQAPVTCQGD